MGIVLRYYNCFTHELITWYLDMTTLSRQKIPLFLTFCLSLNLFSCSNNTVNEHTSSYEKYSVEDFENTLMNLDIAISEHNYRIIHRSTIGQAIRDRGEKDFPLSTITEFCNITSAREMMEINPDLINAMPCRIAVREDPDGVLVSTRLMNESVSNPKQAEFAKRINQNLKAIIADTVQ